MIDIRPAIRAVARTTDADAWATALSGPMADAGIDTPNRIAAFIGQVAVESLYFTRLSEDLDYTPARLVAVWPHRFPNLETAMPYARNPRKLANHVYANRMGNGNEASGDGWTYRGAGLIQITGRAAFERFAPAPTDPRTPEGAAVAACRFWFTNKLNAFADEWQITRITVAINGGMTSAAERQTLCAAALRAITQPENADGQ